MRVATPRYPNSKLRYQRQQHCWTQSQVADKLYALLNDTELAEHGVIERNMVSKWEGGLHAPNAFWQGKLCELFAASPEELGFIKRPETEQEVGERLEAEQEVGEQPAIIAAELSLPAATSVPAESEVVVPPSIWKQMRPLRLVTLDEAIWCATEVNDINALAADWCGQGLSIQHLQTQVHSEIEGWNDMAPPQSSRAGEQLVTRRAALATLALVSAALLKKVQLGPLTALLMEEFLAQCSVSITACHQLLRSDGFAAVEYALPQYLSLLTAIARYPSSYQQKAAYLASQGCRLMGLLSYHRLQFQEQVTYSKQAVEYAKLVGDRALCVMALAALGNAWDHMGDSAEMLRTFQEAVRSLDGVPLLVRSRVLAELAVAYAQQGQVQEALHYSGQARTVFSEEEDLPSFLFMNYDISHIIMNEGSAALRLGQHAEAGHDTTQASRRYQQAWDKLAQIEQVPRTIVVPERIRLRIVTQRSLAAVKLGNLEAFRAYLIEGVNGAQRLGSQKRRQEAIVSYRAAREKWPHESRVSELAELFLQ